MLSSTYSITEHDGGGETVNLSWNRIGAAGARGFAENNATATTVDLSWNEIGAAGARGFAENNTTATTVNLSGNRIGAAGAQAFAEKNTTATTVDLSGNRIGAAGARGFAENNATATTVNLSGNRIGAAGAQAFAENNTTATTVDLSGNRIGAAGAQAFAEKNTTATTVDLSWNQIGAAGARGFAENNATATTVNLSGNRIGAAGAQAFAEKNTTATTVDLSWNRIGAAGARGFAENNATATTVNLSGNRIGAEGAQAFAEKNTTATTVNLSWNQIGAGGARGFAEKNTVAQRVDLSNNPGVSTITVVDTMMGYPALSVIHTDSENDAQYHLLLKRAAYYQAWLQCVDRCKVLIAPPEMGEAAVKTLNEEIEGLQALHQQLSGAEEQLPENAIRVADSCERELAKLIYAAHLSTHNLSEALAYYEDPQNLAPEYFDQQLADQFVFELAGSVFINGDTRKMIYLLGHGSNDEAVKQLQQYNYSALCNGTSSLPVGGEFMEPTRKKLQRLFGTDDLTQARMDICPQLVQSVSRHIQEEATQNQARSAEATMGLNDLTLISKTQAQSYACVSAEKAGCAAGSSSSSALRQGGVSGEASLGKALLQERSGLKERSIDSASSDFGAQAVLTKVDSSGATQRPSTEIQKNNPQEMLQALHNVTYRTDHRRTAPSSSGFFKRSDHSRAHPSTARKMQKDKKQHASKGFST